MILQKRMPIDEIWDANRYASFASNSEFMAEVNAEVTTLETTFSLSHAFAQKVAFLELYMKWHQMMPVDFTFKRYVGNKLYFVGDITKDIHAKIIISLHTKRRRFKFKHRYKKQHKIHTVPIASSTWPHLATIYAKWPDSKHEAGTILRFIMKYTMIDELMYGGSTLTLKAIIAIAAVVSRPNFTPIIEGTTLLIGSNMYDILPNASRVLTSYEREADANYVRDEVDKILAKYRISDHRARVVQQGAEYFVQVPNIIIKVIA